MLTRVIVINIHDNFMNIRSEYQKYGNMEKNTWYVFRNERRKFLIRLRGCRRQTRTQTSRRLIRTQKVGATDAFLGK